MSTPNEKSQPSTWSELKDELQKLEVDEIEQELRSLESGDLLFLKHTETADILGPFEKSDLKAALPDEAPIAADLLICSADQDPQNAMWSALLENPYFQRRKPQLMSTGVLESVEENHFYVLREGQKFGPLELSELKNLVALREVLATDLISVDGGETFGKLYEWDEFDRRNFEAQVLPQRPNEDFLTLGNIEVLKDFKANNSQHVEAEAMANLAYVGHVKNGKVLEWNPQASTKVNHTSTTPRATLEDTTTQALSSYFYAMVFAVSVIGILYMGLTWQTPSESGAARSPASFKEMDATELNPESQSATKPLGVAPHTLTPIEKIPADQIKQVKRMREGKIRPLAGSKKSFRESNSFKRALRDNALLDDGNLSYDDGSGAMEQDPVRSQISKETFDPELSPAEEALADEPYPEDLAPSGVVAPRPIRRPASVGKSWVDDASDAMDDEVYQDVPEEMDFYESEPLD